MTGRSGESRIKREHQLTVPQVFRGLSDPHPERSVREGLLVIFEKMPLVVAIAAAFSLFGCERASTRDVMVTDNFQSEWTPVEVALPTDADFVSIADDPVRARLLAAQVETVVQELSAMDGFAIKLERALRGLGGDAAHAPISPEPYLVTASEMISRLAMPTRAQTPLTLSTTVRSRRSIEKFTPVLAALSASIGADLGMNPAFWEPDALDSAKTAPSLVNQMQNAVPRRLPNRMPPAASPPRSTPPSLISLTTNKNSPQPPVVTPAPSEARSLPSKDSPQPLIVTPAPLEAQKPQDIIQTVPIETKQPTPSSPVFALAMSSTVIPSPLLLAASLPVAVPSIPLALDLASPLDGLEAGIDLARDLVANGLRGPAHPNFLDQVASNDLLAQVAPNESDTADDSIADEITDLAAEIGWNRDDLDLIYQEMSDIALADDPEATPRENHAYAICMTKALAERAAFSVLRADREAIFQELERDGRRGACTAAAFDRGSDHPDAGVSEGKWTKRQRQWMAARCARDAVSLYGTKLETERKTCDCLYALLSQRMPLAELLRLNDQEFAALVDADSQLSACLAN